MQTVALQIPITFEEGTIPPRKRNRRLSVQHDVIELPLVKVAPEEAPTALVWHHFDSQTPLHWYDGRLWLRVRANHFACNKEGWATAQHIQDQLTHHRQLNTTCNKRNPEPSIPPDKEYTSRQRQTEHLAQILHGYLLIGDALYTDTPEPVYRLDRRGNDVSVHFAITGRREEYYRADEWELLRNTAIQRCKEQNNQQMLACWQKDETPLIEILMPEVVRAELPHADPGYEHYADLNIRIKLNSSVLAAYGLTAQQAAEAYVLQRSWSDKGFILHYSGEELESELDVESTIVTANGTCVPIPEKPLNNKGGT